ncbi:protein kinase domain-containing protein [Bowdeniella massiliensis]|uniref:protein kinase domain-containing protein n=1 Tax=Bowdeniella massiliensis TaxID=2932264 RepID=UPI002027A5CF|nr:protein kinase [Bowdeniella massiliensis]
MEISGYQVLTQLSAGDVFEGRTPAGTACVLAFVAVPSAEEARAFQRRLGNLRTMHHAHIVMVIDVVVVDNDRVMVVYEALSGTTLATILAARGELSGPEIAHIWDGVGSAVAALHERGIIHGDVSSENVMITADGQAILIDVCAPMSTEVGTEGFVAPERMAGGPASIAGDVYSVAALIRALSPVNCLTALLNDALHHDPTARPSCRDLVARHVELARPEPVSMPSDASLAAARIRRRLPATEIKPRRRARAGRSRSVVPKATAILAAGCVIVGGWFCGRALMSEAAEGRISHVDVTLAPATQPALPTKVEAVDPISRLEALLKLRDEALMSGDQQLLERVYTPEAPALLTDRQTLREWAKSKVRIAGLETDFREGLEVNDRIEGLVSASTHSRLEDGKAAQVPASEAVCMRFTIEADRISLIEACERAEP